MSYKVCVVCLHPQSVPKPVFVFVIYFPTKIFSQIIIGFDLQLFPHLCNPIPTREQDFAMAGARIIGHHYRMNGKSE